MDILVFLSGLIALGGIYAMLAVSLNVNGGMLGLWDLGVVGYFAVGAYSYTLLTHDSPGLGMPMIAGVIGSVVITGLLSLFIGYTSLRLQSEYLLITTFAFAEIIRIIAANEEWLTNGNIGIFGLDRPFQDFIPGTIYMLFFAGLVLVVLAIYYVFAQKLADSPMGRYMRAIRENEQVTQSIGKKIFATKLKVFILSSCMVGLAGCFYVWYMSIIAPNMFTSAITFTVWTALVLGGMGNNRGAVVGAFVLILVQEATRFIPVPAEYSILLAGLRQFISGLMLILVLRFLPQGLIAEKFKSVEKLLNFQQNSMIIEPKGGRRNAAS
ncbi:branched-chain amino acid ABC transporter permease [Peribacillus saganii]|uniref:Branched-chain amino acid ABC transporter permease n=1 Tax=Peribacillus saganii TaxID=2303992 RepID=A0A372LQK4_9BACI|nr:branched-chain amino acid ABC transporter permease [Peribacillus saganii]RFU70485.1 branched-chain amino acid ABC transporter permease [Peribacillus saganii]